MPKYKVQISFTPQEFIITAKNQLEAYEQAKKRLIAFEDNGNYIPVSSTLVVPIPRKGTK